MTTWGGNGTVNWSTGLNRADMNLEMDTYRPKLAQLTELSPMEPYEYIGELELKRPFCGTVWWNSLFWTNFPYLSMTSPDNWEKYKDSAFFQGIGRMNLDGHLGQQFITYGAAREDLCSTTEMPKQSTSITVECMQYEGIREMEWQLPLQKLLPKRDNHMPYEVQARRFHDNGCVHLGINAMEFSEKVFPVDQLDACISWIDLPANQNPSHGTFHALLRINGWPWKINKIGTYETENGQYELKFCPHHNDEKLLWDIIEGELVMAPTGKDGEVEYQGNMMKGKKFYCECINLDWLGPKNDEKQLYDPEIPPEKALVWFVIDDTITHPQTGKKAVKVKLLDEGIVPGWLDLVYLQVWAGGVPLGFLNEMDCDAPECRVRAYRTPEVDGGEEARAWRKVVVETPGTKLVFEEPRQAKMNDVVDMGWAIHESMYRGARLTVGPRPGPWASPEDVGKDEGASQYSASGPPKLYHADTLVQTPNSDYACWRRVVV